MNKIRKLAERGPTRTIRRTINAILDVLPGLEVHPSSTTRVTRTKAGTYINTKRASNKTTTIRPFIVVTVYENYIDCAEINADGSARDADTVEQLVPVLRPRWLGPRRLEDDGIQSVSDLVEENPASDSQTRVVTINATVDGEDRVFKEKQILYPKYQTNDVILAVPIQNGFKNGAGNYTDDDGAEIVWQDLNWQGRTWIPEHQGLAVCINNENKYLLNRQSDTEEE